MSEDKSQPEALDRDSIVVGQLTAGLLHEFNNVLQSIIGLADMLNADPYLPETSKTGVKAIHWLGQRAASIVQKFTVEEVPPESILEIHDLEVVEALTDTEPSEKEQLSILVVEDDPLVLNVVTGMLKQLGYLTLRAQDGVEALEVYNANSNNIGLIIADMAMPKMNGLQLTEEILTKNPEIKIVIMTGYLQEDLCQDVDPDEFGLFGWLEKPMTSERLRQVVKSAFEG